MIFLFVFWVIVSNLLACWLVARSRCALLSPSLAAGVHRRPRRGRQTGIHTRSSASSPRGPVGHRARAPRAAAAPPAASAAPCMRARVLRRGSVDCRAPADCARASSLPLVCCCSGPIVDGSTRNSAAGLASLPGNPAPSEASHGAAAAWERWQEAARINRDGVAVGSGLRVARVSRKQTGRTEGVGKLGRQSPIAAEVGP